MMKTVLGICPDENRPSFESIEVKPYFFAELDYAKGHYDAPFGRVEVKWRRENDGVHLEINSPKENAVIYSGEPLKKGKNIFIVN